MGTTLNRVRVGCDATTASFGELLTEMTVERRDVLPRAGNNKPIACSDAYAARVRKEMAGGMSQEHARLLAVDLCDLRDGVPLELILAPRYRHIAIIKARAGDSTAIRSLRALQVGEMKAEHALNLAQRELDESPDDAAVNARVVREINRYLPKLLELRAECDRRAATYVRRLVAGTARKAEGRQATEVTHAPLRFRQVSSPTSSAVGNDNASPVSRATAAGGGA